MNISLTPELESLFNKKVKSELYHSASEAIGESLHLLQEQDILKELRRNDPRREIMLGIERIQNGQYTEYKADELEQLR